MRGFRRLGGCSTGHLGKGEIKIARLVGVLHNLIARQVRGNSQLLLGPIHIRERTSRTRLDQVPEPRRGTKNIGTGTRLIPSGAGGKNGEQGPIPAVVTYGEVL